MSCSTDVHVCKDIFFSDNVWCPTLIYSPKLNTLLKIKQIGINKASFWELSYKIDFTPKNLKLHLFWKKWLPLFKFKSFVYLLNIKNFEKILIPLTFSRFEEEVSTHYAGMVNVVFW